MAANEVSNDINNPENWKLLEYSEHYGDIREDGTTVIQEQGGGHWPELAREICKAVNFSRRYGWSHSPDGRYLDIDGRVRVAHGADGAPPHVRQQDANKDKMNEELAGMWSVLERAAKNQLAPEYERRLDLFLKPWCLSCRESAGIPTPDYQWYTLATCEKCGGTIGIPVLDEHDFRRGMYAAFDKENE